MQPARTSFHLPSLGQFIISALGLMGLLSAAAALLGLGVVNFMTAGLQDTSTAVIFSTLGTCILAALLNVPSLVIAGFRLAGKELRLPHQPIKNTLLTTNLMLLAWLVVLAVGELAARQAALAWLFLPPLQILAVALPIGFFLLAGLKGLRPGSTQRTWGLVSFGITVTQPIILVLEGMVIVIAAAVILAWVASQPGMQNELQRLAMRLMNSQSNPQVLENILMPYLEKPAVIFGGLLFTAGLIPLIEELFKPLALWALAGRRFSPQEGFAMGLICGAIFALVESLGMMSSAPAEGWALSAVGRMGTALLHMVTTALTSWGLAMAWQQKRYLQLGAAILCAVFFHGVWNTFGVLAGFGLLSPTVSLQARLGTIAPLVLAFLTLQLFVLMVIGNRLMQPSLETTLPPVEEPVT